jgi:hypothetical protein
MANGISVNPVLGANITACQRISAISTKELNFIILPGKTGAPLLGKSIIIATISVLFRYYI